MPNQVINGALCKCTFGMAPSALVVLPQNRTQGSYVPAANVMDHKPNVNIMPFGMCTSPTNPAVAAATAAAMGVLTPQPCVPVTPSPWVPGSPTVLIGNAAALNDASICNCLWAGVISITSAGQITIQVP